jgi:hypothetical protein
MARLAVAAVSVLGLVFGFPAVARAVPPVCPDGLIETEPGVAVDLPIPSCTNADPPVTFVIPPGGQPAHGSLTAGSPNVYAPTPGYHGADEFKYQIRNGLNELSNIATVRVIVDNDPRCASTSVTVPANVPTTLPGICSDLDGDALDIFVSDPAHGTVTFSGASVIYTPAPGYSGPDSLTLYAADDFYASNDATLSITVAPPPVPIATVAPTPIPAPKDLTAPKVALKNASKKQALALSLTTNERSTATLTATLDQKTAKKLKLSRTVGTLKVALTPGTSTLKVKLSAKAAKAFKKLKKVKLSVTAVVTDTAGNKTTLKLTVTLKR